MTWIFGTLTLLLDCLTYTLVWRTAAHQLMMNRTDCLNRHFEHTTHSVSQTTTRQCSSRTSRNIEMHNSEDDLLRGSASVHKIIFVIIHHNKSLIFARSRIILKFHLSSLSCWQRFMSALILLLWFQSCYEFFCLRPNSFGDIFACSKFSHLVEIVPETHKTMSRRSKMTCRFRIMAPQAKSLMKAYQQAGK